MPSFPHLRRIGAIALAWSLPLVASAQGFVEGVQGGVDKAGSPLGFGEGSMTLQDIVGTLIYSVLSLVGVVLLVIFIYAGFLWMTARGDKDQVTKARTMIINAVIGLVITFASYAIATFVLEQLAGTTGGNVGASSV